VSHKYTICIATFVKRFDKYFKPLLKSIKTMRPDSEIIVVVNGEHNQKFDQNYRRNMLTFLADYDNVYPIVLTEHRACSKLWNTALLNSTNDLCLRIDDDITIPDVSFFERLESVISETNGKSFKINRSWSHTFLNRLEVDKVGWFDERFLGGGEEDGDFEWRWQKQFGEKFLSIEGFPILNHMHEMSYEDCLVGHRKVNGKRSMFNLEFVNKKYKEDSQGESYGIMCEENQKKLICVDPTPNQYPNESFYWENKSNL
jgi:glycosyltransferase involved in cell wall biosynthesis